jgi:hypothetical protein
LLFKLCLGKEECSPVRTQGQLVGNAWLLGDEYTIAVDSCESRREAERDEIFAEHRPQR